MITTRHHAFTLVELSIVLVILGLLIGGVLTGQSLIRAAELRAISSEAQRYQTAIHTFRDKYMGLPGDLTNAQSYWGVAHATASTCVTTASTTSVTCNGNGDGNISLSNATGSNEPFRAWQHLANAGLIEGTFPGVSGSAGTQHSVPGTNVPNSKYGRGTGWSYAYYYPSSVLSSNYFVGPYGNMLTFGTNGAMDDDHMNDPAIKADEAYNVDMKLDDGKPNTGRVLATPNASRPDCVAATNDAYLLGSTVSKACNLNIISGT